LPVIKRLELEVDHSHPLSVEVKNYETTPPYAFMAWGGKTTFYIIVKIHKAITT
jgi:hypothetical protein